MASIRKRNGKWQVQVRIASSNPTSRTFQTKSEAKRWALEQELVGTVPTSSESELSLTVGDILNRYGREISPTKRSNRREQSVVRLVSKYPINNVKLNDLTEGKAAHYRDTRLRLVKPSTIVRELAVLSHALELARRVWDIPLKENAFRKVQKPRVTNARTRRLEHDELERIYFEIDKRGCYYLKDIIVLALETAARGCELFEIEPKHIDLERLTVYFPITKNGCPRTIPISPKAKVIIHNILTHQGSDCKLIQQSGHQIKRNWRICVRKAGITNIRFHDLRHEAISRFFELGLSVPEVALISGHRDFKMLARYTHIRPENVAKKLADIHAATIKSEAVDVYDGENL